jgi:hypothetical protein
VKIWAGFATLGVLAFGSAYFQAVGAWGKARIRVRQWEMSWARATELCDRSDCRLPREDIIHAEGLLDRWHPFIAAYLMRYPVESSLTIREAKEPVRR